MLTKEDGDICLFSPLNVDDLASDLGYSNCDLVFSSENEDLLNFGDVGELEAAKIIRFEAQFHGSSMVLRYSPLRIRFGHKLVPEMPGGARWCLVLGVLLGVRIISPINPPSSCVLHIIHLPHLPERLVSGEQTKRESHV